jgi:hypothetical protein
MSKMKFRNYGGVFQFEIKDAEDLSRIHEIDFARWSATAAPCGDLRCDEGFLKYVDAEGTGRIHAKQIVTARDWLFARLKRRDAASAKKDVVTLEHFDDGDLGSKLRAAAVRVNREQKAADADRIALADVRAFKASYKKLLFNGDGVIPGDVVTDAEISGFVNDIVATVGGVKDRGGSDGADGALLDKFKAQGKAWLDWKSKAKEASVWGDDTTAASALCTKLDAKIEEYFLQCDLLRQETPTEGVLKLKEDDFRALRAKDSAAIEAYLSSSPLAAPNVKGTLDLNGPVNSLYRGDMADLKSKVVTRVLGATTTELTRDTWRQVKATFDSFKGWEASKPPEPFDALGEEKMRRYLDGDFGTRLSKLFEDDKGAAPELDQIDDLEKVLLYTRWMIELTNNFVNFSQLYHPSNTALIERGSLVIDGRRLDFCIEVGDRGAHKPIASESQIFLVYTKITDKVGGTSFEIVSPVTAGEKGRLREGKRGVFYDLDDKEWDAEIVEIVENPISVKEAMFAPFRRAAKFVGDKVEAWIDSAADAQQASLASKTESAVAETHANAEAAAAAATTPRPAGAAAAAPKPEGLNINTLILGGGMALAGLGAVLASIFGMLTSLKGWAAILGIVVVVMAISALRAWIKLRRRDLSVLLEANGWAVNAHTNVTARVARVFAFTPDLPKDRTLDPTDALPEADDEGSAWPAVFVLLLIASVGLYVAQMKGLINLMR